MLALHSASTESLLHGGEERWLVGKKCEQHALKVIYVESTLNAMDETSAISPGRVLRAWRGYAQVSAADVARALFVERGAVTMWESDQRSRKIAASLVNIERYAKVLEGLCEGFAVENSQAMVAMWQAASSPEALPERTIWFHNWPEGSQPVWIWLRSHPDRTDQQVLLEVGPFREPVDLASYRQGLIVHSPISVPNPPVKIVFAQPGWADFACGVVPQQVADALGIGMLAAGAVVGRHRPRVKPLDGEEEQHLGKGLAGIRAVARWFEVPWAAVAPHLGAFRPFHRTAVQSLGGDAVEAVVRPGDAPPGRHPRPLASQALMAPDQIRRVRDARGLSRAAAAGHASDLDPSRPISDKALERWETAGRVPEARYAIARLDMVYGTDGHLGIDRVYDSHNHRHPGWPRGVEWVTFPAFWRGHVWLQPRGPQPDAVGTLELIWGPWRRRQRLRSGSVVTTRKAALGESPLEVRLPRGWHLTAGTGLVPTALDINAGWWPVGFKAALSIIGESVEAIRRTRQPPPPTPPVS